MESLVGLLCLSLIGFVVVLYRMISTREKDFYDRIASLKKDISDFYKEINNLKNEFNLYKKEQEIKINSKHKLNE